MVTKRGGDMTIKKRLFYLSGGYSNIRSYSNLKTVGAFAMIRTLF